MIANCATTPPSGRTTVRTWKILLIATMTCLTFVAASNLPGQIVASTQVSGHILDAAALPVSSADVNLRGKQVTASFHTTTDKSGLFVFSGVPNGSYELTSIVPGFAPAAEPVEVHGAVSIDLKLLVGRSEQNATVTATRTAEALDKVPAAVSVVEAEDFNQRQAYELSDVLQKLPNVELTGGPRPNGQILALRGYTGSELTQLVDGARVDFTNTILSSLYVDPELLKQIEIVRGSTSSLYGSGGLGGAIAVRTKDARDLLEPGETVGGYIKSGYASASTLQRYYGAAYGKTKHLDDLFSFGYVDSQNIRQGGGTYVSPDHFHDFSSLLNVGDQIDARTRLQASNLFYQSRDFAPNNPEANATFPYIQNNHVQQDEATVRLDRAKPDGSQGLSLVAYKTSTKWRADANPGISGAVPTSSLLATWGGSAQNISHFGAGIWGKHTLAYGLDYYIDQEGALTSGAPNGVTPNGTQGVLGLFAQDEIALGSRWGVIAGLRFDRYATSAQGQANGQSTEHLSPKGTISFKATSDLTFYGSGVSGFRAPAVDELYADYFGPGLANFEPNPTLTPETSTQGEGGAVWKHRGIFSPQDGLRFRTDLFAAHDYQLIQLEFVSFTIGKPVLLQWQNIEAARRWGAEWEGDYTYRALQVSGVYSRVRVADSKTGANLYAPPDKGVVKVNYWLPEGRASLSWVTTAEARQDYDSTVARQRAGWTTQDAFVSVFLDAHGRYRLDAGAANLLDKRYSIYSTNDTYYVPEVGRDVRIALSTHF